jgi:hypothetical protein
MSGLTNDYSSDGLRAPTYHQQPPHHPFEPRTKGLVEGACSVLALPLPMGRPGMPGPYARGANGWRQTDARYQHHDHFSRALHMFCMGLELAGNGTPRFLGAAGSPAVRESQMAFIRTLERRPKKGDDMLLRVGVDIEYSFLCDQSLSEFFHNVSQGAFDNTVRPGAERDRENDDDDLVDGVEYDIPVDDDGPRGGRRRARRGRRRGDDDEQEQDSEDDPNDIADAAYRHLLDEKLRYIEGKNVVDKVQIIVHHMTRPKEGPGRRNGGDGRRLEEDAGCVVFFCVKDHLFSVGTPFAKLIAMCEEHEKLRSGVKAVKPTGQRYAQTQKEVSELMRTFPWLTQPDHAKNAMHTLSKPAYLDLVAFVNNNGLMAKAPQRQVNLNRDMHQPGSKNAPNPMHPVNVFTVEWALETMSLYGVPPEQTDYATFRGGPDWMEVRLETMVERWYFDPKRSYHYLMEGWTWARNGKYGLESQYFPWVPIPEALLKHMVVRTVSNALTRYDGANAQNVLSNEYTAMSVIEGVGRPEVLPSRFYDPNQILRKNAIFQVASENARLMGTIKGPRDPELETKAYDLYCLAMREYREACLMRMQQVLVPSTHIYPSMNAILTWMAQEVNKVSVYLPMWTMDPDDADPEMLPLDGFACYIIRQAQTVKHVFFLADRVDRWILVHHGAQDCHATTNVDMHLSAIFHGLSQAGKSWMVKLALEGVCIKGSVSSILQSSEKAWNVHDDSIGLIIFKDEVENIWVDAKAADRDTSGAAERLKSMTSDQRTTYRVLTLVDRPDGGRAERKAETIESLFHATMWCCTNKKVGGGDEAIASRFFNFIMTRSETDLFEMLGLKDRLDDQDKTLKVTI